MFGIKKNKAILFILSAILLAGCGNSEKNVAEEGNEVLPEIIIVDSEEDNTDTVARIEEIGKGCEVYKAGDTFEKAGFKIKVNSARVTKTHGDWINLVDTLDDDEIDGVLQTDGYYAVINMDISVLDDERLCSWGLYTMCYNLKSGEMLDMSTFITTSYHSNLPKEIRDTADVFIDQPITGEEITNVEYVFYMENEDYLTKDNVLCLYAEDETMALINGTSNDKYCFVYLEPEMDF
ncbi:MAG: hypothetical protein HUJ71_08060 [Pseudobutyrivibrio sp.]|nr:hypothetical protein [Pseudobutyrivibrio sp.]